MMKGLFCTIMAMFFLGVGNAQKINWMTMSEALAAQKEAPKKIFMDVYTDWCAPCKLLDKNTLQDEDVASFVNKHFYAVKFDAEGTQKVEYQDFVYTNPNYDPNRKGRNSQHLLIHALNIRGYPTMVFFDENSDVIAPVVGYKTPKQLEIYLKMIASDDYKEVTTAKDWEEYQDDFKGTFDN